MLKEVQITNYQLDIDKLINVLDRIEMRLHDLEEKLSQLDQQAPQEELMTRKEVAAFFKINIATVRNWTIQGTLKKYGVGDRVYFKRTEIETLLIRIN